jgi:hypothetical protein
MRQSDQAAELSGQALSEPRPPVQFLRLQAIAPAQENIRRQHPEFAMRQQRQQERTHELGVGDPGGVARLAPFEGANPSASAGEFASSE